MGDMYGERGRLSPALGEGSNSDSGGGGKGAAEGRKYMEHTGRGSGNARRDLATWAGKKRVIAGWGRRGTRRGKSCGEARASRAGMACARCERERGATRDGHAGAM